jgi:hypothetical protein
MGLGSRPGWSAATILKRGPPEPVESGSEGTILETDIGRVPTLTGIAATWRGFQFTTVMSTTMPFVDWR